MNQAFKRNKAIEYIKHLVDCGDEFAWEPEDIEDEVHSILAYYGIDSEMFTDESLGMIRDELMELWENSREIEMVRIYGVDA